MIRQLESLASVIADYLQSVLDTQDPVWWQRDVLSCLTDFQRRQVEERGLTSLQQLDLAALLQIVDRQFPSLRERRLLTFDDLELIKASKSVRRRWAHVPAAGYTIDDEYRDMDTVVRLMAALDAEPGTLVAAREQLRRVRTAMSSTTPERRPGADPMPRGDRLAAGTKVRLRARPDSVGVVMQVAEVGGAPRYRVFMPDGEQDFFEDQIEPVATKRGAQEVSAKRLRSLLTAAQLNHASARYLFSLKAGRIDFIPYQYRPVLRLINADRPRLLVADEVGVGKTIEAGLIIKELRARREVESVLIICPKPLVTEGKWREEMRRFGEEFEHLDGPTLRHCVSETDLDGRWPARYGRAILPYSLLDSNLLMGSTEGRTTRKGLVDLDPAPWFDLVIVDEAHYVRNTETWAHRNVRFFVDNAEAVVFLTATPVQMHSDDLYQLLRLLRPDQIRHHQDFRTMAEPNPALNRAIAAVRRGEPGWREDASSDLDAALATQWGRDVISGDPLAEQAKALLAGPATDEARVHATRVLESLYTFSHLINRTRRRDVGEFTVRKPQTIQVDFTPDQQALHDEILDLERRILQAAHGSVNTAFMMSTIRRQVASCVYGLAPLLADILERRFSDLAASEADGPERWNPAEILAFSSEIEAMIQLAATLDTRDPKFEQLMTLIEQKQGVDNNKVLLFSTFRHTLAYLESRLNNSGVRVGLVHGDVPEDQRRDLRRRFALPREESDSLDVLLSSEVGTEGLDYQFCDMLVNYDLPWNPMRIEQRIGRIDRYGQMSETVAIVNMITRRTIDADIYDRCLSRIGIFERSVGGSEEILGTLSAGIRSIADDLALTPDERQRKLQQLADNEIRVMAELAELEDRDSELFGLAIAKEAYEAVADAQSPWLTTSSLQNLVDAYLADLGYDPARSWRADRRHLLRPAAAVRDALLADFKALADDVAPKSVTRQDMEWRRWLTAGEPSLAITVNRDELDRYPDTMLLDPAHALVRQATRAHAIQSSQEVRVRLRAGVSEGLPAGRHPFLAVGWNALSLRDDFEIRFITLGDSAPDAISRALQGPATSADDIDPVTPQEQAALEEALRVRWIEDRARHIEDAQSLVDSRLRSLTATHRGRIAQLEDQRDSVTDRSIRRMRDSQIEAAEADFGRRRSQLEKARQQADITTQVLATGVLVCGD